ncbi:MAG: transposase [Chloroflexota bacterium]|nr:transposase [Chloroflexota bacterium]
MITIGVDAHKRVHLAVAVDEAGREVARWRGPNSAEGWRQVASWGDALGTGCRWGIEGSGGYGRGLAQFLVAAGAAVYEVNPRWTAASRHRARTLDKSDRLDARAVALLVWREVGALPRVAADDDTVALDLLVTEREDLVAETTRLYNQVHQLLLQIDPEYATRLPKLQTQAGLRALETYAAADAHPVQQHRAAAVRRLAQRLRLALEQAKALAALYAGRRSSRPSLILDAPRRSWAEILVMGHAGP